MAVSLRLSDEKVAALDRLAQVRGVSRSELIEQGVEVVLQGPTRPPALLRLSKSQRQCLEQLSERAGTDAATLLTRWISERLSREFIDDRNRLMDRLKLPAR